VSAEAVEKLPSEVEHNVFLDIDMRISDENIAAIISFLEELVEGKLMPKVLQNEESGKVQPCHARGH
jgi:hypothetical protein